MSPTCSTSAWDLLNDSLVGRDIQVTDQDDVLQRRGPIARIVRTGGTIMFVCGWVAARRRDDPRGRFVLTEERTILVIDPRTAKAPPHSAGGQDIVLLVSDTLHADILAPGHSMPRPS